MKKEIEDFLREINGGKINKAQKKLADLLKVSEPTVSNWLSGKIKMSDENAIKLANKTHRTREEIQKIFAVNSVIGDNNVVGELKNKELELKDKEIEIQKREIDLLKKELEVWKLGYTIGVIKKRGGK